MAVHKFHLVGGSLVLLLFLLACNILFFDRFVHIDHRHEVILPSSERPPPSLPAAASHMLSNYAYEENTYDENEEAWTKEEEDHSLWPDLSLMPWAEVSERTEAWTEDELPHVRSSPPPPATHHGLPPESFRPAVRSLPNLTSPQVINQQEWPLWWHAPFFDKTSFGHEASGLLLSAIRSGAVNESSVWIGLTQGSCSTDGSGIDDSDHKMLNDALKRADPEKAAIVVCHSLPPFWSRPLPHWPSCHPCPPIGYTAAVAIGRAMAETIPYNVEFVRESNRMDEVWVPSKFSRDTLIASGVPEEKLRILPIAVNVSELDPSALGPLKLPFGELMLGRSRRFDLPPWEVPSKVQTVPQNVHDDFNVSDIDSNSISDYALSTQVKFEVFGFERSQEGFDPPPFTLLARIVLSQMMRIRNNPANKNKHPSHPTRPRPSKPYVFVSVFKFEKRKGWDILLEAYFREFSSDDDVELYILTKPFLSSDPHMIKEWVPNQLNLTAEDLDKRAATLYVSSEHISSETYRHLLRASDCFVLPSRGEGWGMPATEAMSMGLPVIVTNWSGAADVVDDSVGSLIPFNLTTVPETEPWWFFDAQWADADITALQKAMRRLYDHRDESERKGQAARQRMIDLYSPEVVARLLAKELERIKAKLRSGECWNSTCFNSTYVAKPGDEYRYGGWSREDLFLIKPSERKAWHFDIQKEMLLEEFVYRPLSRGEWLVLLCMGLPMIVLVVVGCCVGIWKLERMQQEEFEKLRHRPIKLKTRHREGGRKN